MTEKQKEQIIELGKQMQEIWRETEHEKAHISIAVFDNFLSIFVLDENDEYVMNYSHIDDEEDE